MEEARAMYHLCSYCMDCIVGDMRRFSKDSALISPKEGYEVAYADMKEKRRIMGEMLEHAHIQVQETEKELAQRLKK